MRKSHQNNHIVEIPQNTDLNNPSNEQQGQSIPLSSVDPKPIEWLQKGRIPLGKVTVIAGDPDVGKTFLTLDIASKVSTGADWPDGSSNTKGKVVIMSAEDDLADTIVPRLISAGANLDNIFSLSSIPKVDKKSKKIVDVIPTLTSDFEAIKQEISIRNPRLLIIDPINAYLPGVDTNGDAELRTKVYGPLKKLAEEHEVAIICVKHLNKGGSQNAKHRISGSIANVGASRATWLVVSDKDDAERKLMLPVKFNIGPNPTGLAYRIVEYNKGEPIIEWEKEPIDMKADDALMPESTPSFERDIAKEFILDLLKDGAVPSKEIFKQAKEMSISERTLNRAKQALKVKAFRKGIEGVQGGGNWYWELPK